MAKVFKRVDRDTVRCMVCAVELDTRDFDETPDYCEGCGAYVGECDRCHKLAVVVEAPMNGDSEDLCRRCHAAAVVSGEVIQ